jgi:5-methyltetrahydropteroyltriglutamate--homocysteine methyltransferase
VKAFVPGIYPRSEPLVQATRDLDRGRTTQEAVDEQVARDFEQFVSLQREAGVDLLADGMLGWQDLFRPFLTEADGLRTGPLTRFLDTNTFYRAPQVENGEVRLRNPLDERFVALLPEPRLVTLPSPFALSLGTGAAPKELAEAALKPELEGLEAELVVLSEPFLARTDDPDLDELAAALEALAGGPPLALQLTFGDAAPLLRRGLADLPVDGIGIDFYATSARDLPQGFDKLLLAGVVDARNSLLEDPGELAAFAAELADRAADVALVPNGDLQYVSEPIASEKVVRLGQAKTTAVQEAAS